MTTSPVSTTSPLSELKSKIELREARVGIIGLGYVGLPLAMRAVEVGYWVVGDD